MTRNWASSAASRAHKTVTEEKGCILITSHCQKQWNLAYKALYPGYSLNHLIAMNSSAGCSAISYRILIFTFKKKEKLEDKPGKGKHGELTSYLEKSSVYFIDRFFCFSPSETSLPTLISWVLLMYVFLESQHKARSISNCK